MPRLSPLDPRLAARPHIAQSIGEHYELVMQDGTVPQLTKELCAALIAGLHDCRPALVAHRGRARMLGAGSSMLSALWDFANSGSYDGAQKAALAAAVALTREPRALPDAVWRDLRAQYDDAQIVELFCAIGLANYLNRVSNALQTEITKR